MTTRMLAAAVVLAALAAPAVFARAEITPATVPGGHFDVAIGFGIAGLAAGLGALAMGLTARSLQT